MTPTVVFHRTETCRSRRHCRACLDMRWHKLDACPHGVTADNLPSQLDAAMQAHARGEVYAPPGRCKGCGG